MAKDVVGKTASAPALPPSYEETVKAGAPLTHPAPPPQYSEEGAQHVRVVYLPAPSFGPTPVRTVCPACQASITTATSSKPSMMAWAASAVLCFTMLWPCFCIPFCVDSLKDVKHKCPHCSATLGRYRGV